MSKAFGDRLLIDKLSFKAPPGAIVGIIGPNGAGKSTQFKMVVGREMPDCGEVVIGSAVKFPFVEQMRDDLSDKKAVFEDVSGGSDTITVGKFKVSSGAYLGRFNFKGGDQQKLVGRGGCGRCSARLLPWRPVRTQPWRPLESGEFILR